ncbi:mechanosensitive ion channel family protein [Opitutus terrae]|uniref:MscS Mechanosensitive ion channel n=1 Tax=Opitutus terrae (strain DSM 11246 / JCM 15787 / PB90-1) TaxID=452637 RepID=B1ZWT3_OPITP|nr:mechanosensitive ion channel domain-containing protein [Opitutus terrae]ACB74210.1 MscS Mechanosensitive ion channel [Opitutus terrae PB90-1]
MRRRALSLFTCVLLAWVTWIPALTAQPTEPTPPPQQSANQAEQAAAKADEAAQNATKAAAAVTVQRQRAPEQPDFLEHLVDQSLELFDVRTSENTTAHFVIACLFLVLALLARRITTGWVFVVLKRLAARTATTLDDKMFPALEAPVSTFIALVGIFAALAVLKLPATTDTALSYGQTIAFSLVVFWGLLRAFGALLDHVQEISVKRGMGVAAFMPWIKKTLISVFVVVGVLMVVQSLGYDVKALLAGLGIGGLAFALAAQDTLANVFGSIVVAIDQPFKLGEFVDIGGRAGTVEDIGLRSTKLRRADKALIVVPNKTVAAESILNLSRFTGRRAEQVLNLTYDTKPEQMQALVEEIRTLLKSESYIDPSSVLVYFRDLSASSLDIWIAYNTRDGDFGKHMELRQRMNLEFMRRVAARGLAFAFPTQTVQLEGEVARKLAERPAGPPAAAPEQPRG